MFSNSLAFAFDLSKRIFPSWCPLIKRGSNSICLIWSGGEYDKLLDESFKLYLLGLLSSLIIFGKQLKIINANIGIIVNLVFEYVRSSHIKISMHQNYKIVIDCVFR